MKDTKNVLLCGDLLTTPFNSLNEISKEPYKPQFTPQPDPVGNESVGNDEPVENGEGFWSSGNHSENDIPPSHTTHPTENTQGVSRSEPSSTPVGNGHTSHQNLPQGRAESEIPFEDWNTHAGHSQSEEENLTMGVEEGGIKREGSLGENSVSESAAGEDVFSAGAFSEAVHVDAEQSVKEPNSNSHETPSMGTTQVEVEIIDNDETINTPDTSPPPLNVSASRDGQDTQVGGDLGMNSEAEGGIMPVPNLEEGNLEKETLEVEETEVEDTEVETVKGWEEKEREERERLAKLAEKDRTIYQNIDFAKKAPQKEGEKDKATDKPKNETDTEGSSDEIDLDDFDPSAYFKTARKSSTSLLDDEEEEGKDLQAEQDELFGEARTSRRGNKEGKNITRETVPAGEENLARGILKELSETEW